MTTEEDRAQLPTEVQGTEGEVGQRTRQPPVRFRWFEQLKQRNVFRVAALYLVVCWLILEPVHVVFHMLDVPIWANRFVVVLMAVGFPAVVIFVEKLWRYGKPFAQAVGVALMTIGILAIWFPWLLPGLHASGMPAM